MRSNRRGAATSEDPDTRARLLRAAARTFGERGFRAATVREVCRGADANVAAVSYHFGSKEQLYLAALREALSFCADDADGAVGSPPPADRIEARDRLRAIIRGFAARFMQPKPGWHVRLVQREMLEPTFALETVTREFMKPRFEALERALAVLLPEADERTLGLHAMSVIGQLMYHRAAGPVALKLLGESSYHPALVEQVIEHVTRFTERALGASAPGLARARRGRGGVT